MLHRHPALLLLLATLLPITGEADIFRCVGENGELSFSQTPCPNSKVTVQASSERRSDEPSDCEYAHRFALATAREMKAGKDSSTVFDHYGGLNALSRGSVSLVSYVYQYRTNDEVSAARIAALSVAKCQARSFGDVSCEELPGSFTSRIGGCKQRADNVSSAMPFIEVKPPRVVVAPQESRSSQQAAHRAARAKEKQQREECRNRIRPQIDRINSQMRSGYSASRGIRLRERRRDLEQRLREC